MKALYPQAIDSARASIKLAPAAAEPHLWLADSLRLLGKYPDASTEYTAYLRLSDFDSGMAGRMNYYVLGFLAGIGKKSRAAQADIWRDMRSLAYFGLCDSERMQNRFDFGVAYCQKALAYDPKDPYTHYALALCYARVAAQSGSLETLAAARKHFQVMLELNANLEEAKYARQNLQNIDEVLKTR
jgi:tetratricopeptide (TPR) repeat protein